MCVTGRRRRGRPHKVYIFLISINSRVDIAMSVCPSVRPSVCPSVRLSVPFLNTYISETIRARATKFGMKVHLYIALMKFVLEFCHAPLRPRKFETKFQSRITKAPLMLAIWFFSHMINFIVQSCPESFIRIG